MTRVKKKCRDSRDVAQAQTQAPLATLPDPAVSPSPTAYLTLLAEYTRDTWREQSEMSASGRKSQLGHCSLPNLRTSGTCTSSYLCRYLNNTHLGPPSFFCPSPPPTHWNQLGNNETSSTYTRHVRASRDFCRRHHRRLVRRRCSEVL